MSQKHLEYCVFGRLSAGASFFLVPGGSLGTPATSLIFLFLLSLSAAFDFGGMIKIRMRAGNLRISRVFAPKRF